MIDFDHNATTPLDPRVRAAVVATWDEAAGNPSSLHATGRAARGVLENARREVATALGVEPLGVTFTSGGTEANALGIEGAHDAGARWAVTTTIEHASVRSSVDRLEATGVDVVRVQPDNLGLVSPRALGDALDELGARTDLTSPGVVAFSVANTELGNVLDARLVPALRERLPRAWVHLDAVQAIGKLPLTRADWDADSLAISGHKIGAPRGTGALVHASHAALRSRWGGGGQERGRRPGTENVAGLVGLGVAARLAAAERAQRRAHVSELRQRLVDAMARLDGVRVEGDPDANVGNTALISVDGCTGEVLMMNLDLEGIAVSTGSACSAGSFRPSPVLLGLGRSEARARRAIRVSFGVTNTEAEVDAFVELLPRLIERSRRAEHGGPA